MESITLKVNGMTCDGCARSVTKALKAVPGVGDVEVSLARSEAQIAYAPREVSVERIKTAINDAGYEAG
jgi:copper chaperone